MQYASQNLIPITLELGGKSPNIFFEDVMDKMMTSLINVWKVLQCLLLTKVKFVLVQVEY
jgi:hypothetical protein